MNWRTAATFQVMGEPKGQPRPRAYSRGGKAGVYDPGTSAGWKALVALAAREYLPAEPIESPVRLTVRFYLPRPKRLCRKADPAGRLPHPAKPDADNLVKGVMDALNDIRFWRDDALVFWLDVRKEYCSTSGRPGADIQIDVLERATEPTLAE